VLLAPLEWYLKDILWLCRYSWVVQNSKFHFAFFLTRWRRYCIYTLRTNGVVFDPSVHCAIMKNVPGKYNKILLKACQETGSLWLLSKENFFKKTFVVLNVGALLAKIILRTSAQAASRDCDVVSTVWHLVYMCDMSTWQLCMDCHWVSWDTPTATKPCNAVLDIMYGIRVETADQIISYTITIITCCT